MTTEVQDKNVGQLLCDQAKERDEIDRQRKLKEYLDIFYQRIYSTRMLIQMHMEIANTVRTKNLLYDQYWACMQVSVFVGQITSNMFAIFDENKKHALKQFVAFLHQFHEYSLDDGIIKWFELIKPFEEFRNCKIAHVSIKKPIIPDVDYAVFQTILDEFEKMLRDIHKKHVTHHLVMNGTWNGSELNLDAEVLTDLRKILELSSASKKTANG